MAIPRDPEFIPDTPEDNQPDVVGTPEGDNEFAPDEPLTKIPDEARGAIIRRFRAAATRPTSKSQIQAAVVDINPRESKESI